ncbi:hypothetical protein KHP62_02790 [Rhodobacteraceae bacterium NNCM2]|nr:hypothetical protein [Coraliihabitans acroporae]
MTSQNPHQPQGIEPPLSRLRGGMIAVLAWAICQLLFSVLLLSGLVLEGTSILFMDGIPDAYEYLLWGTMIAGPFLIVPSILTRAPATPWLYAAYIASCFVMMLGAEWFAPNWFAAARYDEADGRIGAALFAAALTIDVIVIVYLFRGRRPAAFFGRGRA